MRSSMSFGSSAVLPPTRIWRLPSSSIGSASCRRASLPATMRRPSRPRREHNGCCGVAVSQLETAEYHFLRRAVSRRLLRFRGSRRAPAAPGRCRCASQATPALGGELPGEFREPRRAGRRRDRPPARAAISRPMHLYEQAIRSARANGFVHNEALANELAARFYAARGFEKVRACMSAGRPLRLRPLGRRRQGAATRSAVSAAPRGRAGLRADRHDRGAGRTPRPRDGDQSVASGVERDRAGKAARHTHAHGDRAGRGSTRAVAYPTGDGAADRGGSHDPWRHRQGAPAGRDR